ncbi:MAG: signal peptidase I [Clostridia bacterium]|nr:signal peptidase I [Clostridia bacterium]
MPRDKKILYIGLSSLIVALLVPWFAAGINNRAFAAALLLPASVAFLFLIKKRSIPYYTKRQVLLLACVFGVLYTLIHYLLGIPFGFRSNPYSFLRPNIVVEFVIPTALAIVGVELIRWIAVAQGSKGISALAYFLGVISEVSVFLGVVRVETFNRFMDLFGLTLLPALIANLVYNYLAKRYGASTNIAYRLIISLHVYVFTANTATPDAITSFIKVLLPVALYVFIDALFERKRKFARKKTGAVAYVAGGAAFAIIASFMMLISCKFHYGAIVIATESMTGELNKGDAVIFEQSDGEDLEVGDVIVFERRGNKIVHRVIDIEVINNEVRIYTKGDANENADAGFITPSDVVGKALTKLPGVGYPTIWMRELVRGAFKQSDAL